MRTIFHPVLRSIFHSAWRDGSLYAPESGKTWSCQLEAQADGTLKVSAGPLGHSTFWKRVPGTAR